ncbi:hypothetical protein CAPN001_15890 [Capnocytophaga stomatis]|uniref:T9SS type B sorting domain-containing protein n=1 Tax=Capnocytophaga stomatis TaxID=1848904 RepID=UPI00194F6B26|nr:gliding motility-associated C-terminal domain-containing protein [Capnocytophaga stomatis]GIJ97020.1 hypothetical protein CAPN001_15890 [Capnocytophaga stomatis]
MKKVFNYMDMRSLYFLILVCSLFGIGELKAQNPQLKSLEDAPPQPSVCGLAETYTVTIQLGTTPQNNVDFRVVLPEYFKYDDSGVQVTQGSVSGVVYNSVSRELTMKLEIPATSAGVSQMKVSFKARVLCGGAESADVADNQRPRMGYYLGAFGSGNSQPIIVKYAVLQTAVTPAASNLPVSGTVERTITVKNGGQGAVQSFKLATTIDSGLQIISSDFTGLSGGWTAKEEASTPGIYQFSGGNLQPGESVIIKQVVKVIACTGLNSSYKSSYGCTEECVSTAIKNTTARPVISADRTPRPSLEFTSINQDGSPVNRSSREGALCMDTDITHIWKIENKGNAAASDLEMTIYTDSQGLQTGSTYFIQGSDSFQWDTDLNFANPKNLTISEQTTWANDGERFGTNTQLRYLKAKLDGEIIAGQVIYVRFKTKNNSYKSTTSCEQKSKELSFGAIKLNHTYKNANICSNNLNFSINHQTMQAVQTIKLDGVNVAGVMVSDGQVYDGKFVFSLFNHGDAGGRIMPGDYFDIILELSPSLTLDMTSLKLLRVDEIEYIPEIIKDSEYKYRLRLKFGGVIYKNTSDKQNGQHNQPQSFITFKATYNCGSQTGGAPAWYKLHMESYKQKSCPSSPAVATQCLTTNLTPTGCTSGCSSGFSRGAAKVERHLEDYGYEVLPLPELDSRALARYPVTKANASTLGVNPSAFHTNDRILVSQIGTISSTTTINWLKGVFTVDLPVDVGVGKDKKYLNLFASGSSNEAIVNANGGRLRLTRGTNVYEIDNLPVTVVGNKATLEFAGNVLAGKGIADFQHNDKLEAFVEIKPNNVDQFYIGQRVFETDFYLIDTSNLQHRCGPNGRANSLFVTSRFRWYKENDSADNTRRLSNCETNLPMTGDSFGNSALAQQIGRSTYFRMNIYLNELIQYNAAFPRENRRFLTPKQVVVTVPQGLDLEGFYVQLSGTGGSNYNYYRLQIPTVSGATYSVDVQDVIKKVLEARYASAQHYIDGMTIPVDIDEGYWMRFTPVVKKNCHSGTKEDLQAYLILDGTGREVSDSAKMYNNAQNIQTQSQVITYSIDNDKISATVAQPMATSNTEEVKWVMKVDNTSTFHTFQNLWLGSEDMTITSVQEASDAAGQVLVGNSLPNSGGVFQLGDLSTRPPTRYFVVKANVPDCGTGNKTLWFGHSCVYPASVADACAKIEIPVSYTKSEGTLQLRILKQPDVGHAPALCELLEYDIEVNNSGRGQAKDIQVRIPLGLNSGLSFEPGSAKLSTKYTTGAAVNPTIALADSNINVTADEIIVTIPNETLAPVEKIRLSLQLRTTNDCNFNLSNQIAFIPSGKNYCGSDLIGGTNAISNLLRYKDDTTNNPKLVVDQSVATIAFSDALATGNPKAKYSLQITNKGDGANQDAITANNAILAIKLPTGWEFVNTSQVEASSGNKLRYQSYDSVTNTYFYQVVTTISVNDVLGIIEAEMTTQSPQNCPVSGNVEADLYYSVPGLHSVCDNAVNGIAPCDAKKTLSKATATMTITIPDATLSTSVSKQFCNNGTVADLKTLVVENAQLAWYDTPAGGTQLSENTPLVAGTYYVALRDKLVLGCESVNRTPVTITTVDCNPIVANDDVFPAVNGNVQSTAGNVLDNSGNGQDTLNGTPATTTNVSISEVLPATSINGNVNIPKIDVTTGNVNVPAGTPAGTYTIVYRICESGNPANNCDTATVTVVISTIEANDDDMSGSPVDGATGNPNVVNVLTNDILNGVPNIPISDVTISVTTQATPIGGSTNVPTLDPTTGSVSVPASTPAGTYTITYQVCTKSNICDTANVVIVVEAQSIDAQDDSFPAVSGNTGGKAGNVLSNNGNGTDMLGANPATVTNVNIAEVTPASPINGNSNVPKLDATGEVDVPAGTPAGTYTIVYSICEKLNPTNCDTATATVVVNSADLVANPDDFSGTPINGLNGGNTSSVLTNDTLNGNPLNPTQVNLTWGTTIPTGLTPNADGTITIAPNTPAGTYTITYTICEKLNPTNCETAEVTIVVTEEPIDAKDDNFPAVSGNTGGKAGNVLSDNGNGLDVLGTNPATIANVNITQVTPASPINGSANIPTLDVTTGDINVPADTPAGTYTIVYRICEKLNPTNCDTATATVEVAALPIVANDDDYTSFPIYTAVGGTVTTSVLVNDTIGGAPATLGTVTISNPTTPNTNIYIDVSNGTVVVLPNTPAGTYTLTYTICENANATNCSNEANVTVVVLDVPKANDDSATTEINTPVTVNILDNDENIPTTGRVAVVTDPSRGTVQVNDGGTPDDPSDDTITYTPNPGFVGTDTFVYELCDAAGNCSNATVTIEVVAGGDIVPYNAISTNDDGSNDIFYIKGIEAYPNNTVRIYNRWGVKVFEAHGYNNTTKVFRGLSNGRVTIEAPEKLPQGTYYYIIEYVDKNNQTKKKGSWLYIKN